MEFLESFGSFLLLFVLPATTGVLSGFVGIHLLFSFVKAAERWRGQKVAKMTARGRAGNESAFEELVNVNNAAEGV